MLFRETRRRIGGDIRITIGAPMSQSEFELLPHTEIATALRSRCLNLGDADPEVVFRWTSHIRWRAVRGVS